MNTVLFSKVVSVDRGCMQINAVCRFAVDIDNVIIFFGVPAYFVICLWLVWIKNICFFSIV